jgi:hypothetical protein
MPAEEIVSMIRERCIRKIQIVPGRKGTRQKFGTGGARDEDAGEHTLPIRNEKAIRYG